MTVTTTETVRDIVTDAHLMIEAATLGHALDSTEGDLGRRLLNRMLKAIQMKGHPVFVRASQTLTLTTAASYTLSPVRPVRISSARLKVSGTETPMIEMTGTDYDELPLKTTTGTPTQFFYDRQREAALFYVWPVLSAANGETVEITYEREIEDVLSLNDTIDVPAEWGEGIVTMLAKRLMPNYGKRAQAYPDVVSAAMVAESEILGSDAAESVTFEANV